MGEAIEYMRAGGQVRRTSDGVITTMAVMDGRVVRMLMDLDRNNAKVVIGNISIEDGDSEWEQVDCEGYPR